MDPCEPGSSRNGRKRALSLEDQNEEVKNTKKFHSEEEEQDEGPNLLDFSDEMMLEILKHADSPTLYSLSSTCIRFRELIKEKKLWVNFDFSQDELTAMEILKRIKYLNPETKTFKIRGMTSKYPFKGWDNSTITKNILTILIEKCPNLKTFAIYEALIDFSKLTILDFPPTLQRLEFNKCEMPKLKELQNFFQKIDVHMKELEELALPSCHWFETHDLVLFSKLPQLRVLDLRGCISMRHCVAYASIASRYGFKKLEVLDLRNTPVSDSDIQCFNMTQTLKQLLLESPVIGKADVKAVKQRTKAAQKKTRRSSAEASSSRSEVTTSDSHQGSEHEDSPNESIPRSSISVNNKENGESRNEASNQERRNVENQNQKGENGENGETSSTEKKSGESGSNSDSDPNQIEERKPIEGQNSQQNDENRSNTVTLILTDPRQNGENRPNADENGENVENRPAENQNQNGENGVYKQVIQSALGPIIIVSGPYRPYRSLSYYKKLSNNNDDDEDSDETEDEDLNCGIYRPTLNCDPTPQISDRGICSYGLSRSLIPNWIWIRAEVRDPNTYLERLVIRNYKGVTDYSLSHLAACTPNLVYLDVSGTSVTREAVDNFLLTKQNCQVVADHLPN